MPVRASGLRMRSGPAVGSLRALSTRTSCWMRFLSLMRRGLPGAMADLGWHSGLRVQVAGFVLRPWETDACFPPGPWVGAPCVRGELAWPSGGRGPLPCSCRQWPISVPPNETAGLQPRGVATEMTVPPCVAPSSSRGSPWAWHSYIGVSSATQDPLVSTPWSRLHRHHRQPPVGL